MSIQSLLYFALLILMVVSLFAQGRVQRVFQKYANEPAASGKTAESVAYELLARYGAGNVRIEPVSGALTDHYNPKTGVVGLSQAVYGERSVSALAVAAHEIGHVLQHEEGYLPIRIRNAVLPAASIGSNLAPWIVILGLFLGSYNLSMVGVVLVFQLATLPAELNASSRALRMLEDGGYVDYSQSDDAKKVLRAAAMTYVLATLAALVSFLRLYSIAASSRRRD